jgi:hypothetical protein
MEPSLQLRAAVYAPQDVVYLRNDGRISFSPRGIYREKNSHEFVISPSADIAYLGKEEFHPSRKKETTERLMRIAAEKLPHAAGYGSTLVDYLEGLMEIALASNILTRTGEPADQKLMLGLLKGTTKFDEVQARIAELMEKIPEAERQAFLEPTEKYALNTAAKELHWLGFSTADIERVLQEDSENNDATRAFFSQQCSSGLGGLATQQVAASLFDKVSGAVGREMGLHAPIAFSFTVDNMGTHSTNETHAPWSFPASNAAREKLLSTFAAFDPDTKKLLAQPLQDPNYKVFMVPDMHLASVLPRFLDAAHACQGGHHPAEKIVYVATETPTREKRNFDRSFGRPAPFFVKEFQYEYIPHPRAGDIRHTTAEELSHGAMHMVFENAGFPYSKNDRAARAGIEKLGAQLQQNPELQGLLQYGHGFDHKALLHLEMPVKALAFRAVEGDAKLRQAWPEMATFVERFMLEHAKKIMQQREGGTGVV